MKRSLTRRITFASAAAALALGAAACDVEGNGTTDDPLLEDEGTGGDPLLEDDGTTGDTGVDDGTTGDTGLDDDTN